MKALSLLLTVVVGLAAAEIAPADFQLLASNQNGEMVANIIRQAVKVIPDPWHFPFPSIRFPINIETPFKLEGTIEIADIQIKGHQGLDVTESVVTVLPIGGNFNFRVPEIVINGSYEIKGMLELEESPTPIPLDGDGPFSLRVSDIKLNTHFVLFSPDLSHLKISRIIYDLDIYDIWVKIEGLFKEIDPTGELNEAVNTILNAYLTILFNMYEAQGHNSIIAYISNEINNQLAKITIAELIKLLIGGGGVPEPEQPSTDLPDTTETEEEASTKPATTAEPGEQDSTTPGSSLNPTVNVGLAFVLIAAALKMFNF